MNLSYQTMVLLKKVSVFFLTHYAHGNTHLQTQCSTGFTLSFSHSTTFFNQIFNLGLNQVLLLGRVGGDPVLKGSSAHPVVLFSMATNSNYKVAEGLKQKTDWHRVSLFKPYLRDLALANMKKGYVNFFSFLLHFA